MKQNQQNNKGHVLLVDDYALLRKSLRHYLKSIQGLEVVGEAQNGYEALKQMEKCNPDIVIMDVVMPVMDGIEAALHIKNLYPEVTIIAYTSKHDKNTIERMVRAGASYFITKGNDLEELSHILKNLVSRGEEDDSDYKNDDINDSIES